MHLCPKDVPQYFIPGNRDIGNEKFKNEGTVVQNVTIIATRTLVKQMVEDFQSEIFIKAILSLTTSPTSSPTSFKGLEIFDVHFLNDKTALIGFEKQFMPGFYYFQVGNRHFITLETQVYKLTNNKAVEQRERQNDWLEYIFRTLPRDAKKTVFMHTALFIEDVKEIHAADKGKSLPKKQS